MYEVYRLKERDGDIPTTYEVVATCSEEGWANDIAVLLGNEFPEFVFGWHKKEDNPFRAYPPNDPTFYDMFN